jgi:hypothetical protein
VPVRFMEIKLFRFYRLAFFFQNQHQLLFEITVKENDFFLSKKVKNKTSPDL